MLKELISMTAGQVFDALYLAMQRHYRCEYLFKNAIASKIVLGRHSMRTASLLTELRADERKADIVVLNGTSSVYEVKTKLDNLDRLADQLAAYRNLFDRIYVVTDTGCEAKILDAVAADIGVVVLTGRYTLRTVRESSRHADEVSPGSIFDTLRVAEYTEILRDEFGGVPDVPNGVRYVECKRQFMKIPPQRAHDAMVRVLKRRASAMTTDAFVASLPHSLRAAGLTTPLTHSQRVQLADVLASPYCPA
jgi:hypothetical protein